MLLYLNIAFNWVIRTTLKGTIVSALILLVRYILREKLSPKICYLLWFLLIISLILPINFINIEVKSNITSVPIKESTVLKSNANSIAKPPETTGINRGFKSRNSIIHYNNFTRSAHVSQNVSMTTVIQFIWLVIALALSLLYLIINISFYKKIIKNSSDIKLNEFENLTVKLNVKKKIKLIKTPAVNSPALYGIIHPKLLCPINISSLLTPDNAKYIILHELMHLKMLDLLTNLVMIIFQVIHWFNPLIWYSFRKMKEDREILCDHMVMSQLNDDEIHEYGNTIINFADKLIESSHFVPLSGLISDKRILKRRIVMIKKFERFKTANYFVVTFSLIMIILFSSTAFTASSPFSVANIPHIRSTDNVKLTIDKNIQNSCNQILKNAINANNAIGGTIIVMDTKSGQVLGMSNILKGKSTQDILIPKYSDNPLFKKDYFNDCISGLRNPGSIIKPIIAAMALDNNVISEKEQFYCNGSINVSGRKINCWRTSPHGFENVATALDNSCSTAFINIGLRIKNSSMIKYFKDFGYGIKTGIELPNEKSGTSIDCSSIINKACASIGTNFEATDLGILNSINCIANDGILLKPYIIKTISDNNNKIIYKGKSIALQTVIRKNTAFKIRVMMESNINVGVGSKAKDNKITMGGTGSTVEEFYDNKPSYDAMFCGFAPANNPKISVIVRLHNSALQYGGVEAAPVFREVIKSILN